MIVHVLLNAKNATKLAILPVTGHFKRECPKLKNNNNRGNQVGGGNAPAKVYAVGHVGTNPDSNVVTGMFLLNNHYASILFDTGADRSFASTAFSSQIDITPTALDHYYDVELADERIIGLNTILKGCTLNILNHPFNIDLMPVELGSFDAIIVGFGHNGAKESKVSETITSVSKVETSNSKTSNDKVEMPKIKTGRMSEPIIEEWESDSKDDEIVVKPKEVTKTVKPSFKKIESVNARNETKTANYNRYFNKRVNNVKSTRVNTVRPKAEVNTVKASASWVWKPKHEELNYVFKSNSASKTLTRYDYVDALGRKREVLYGINSHKDFVFELIVHWKQQCKRHLLASLKQMALGKDFSNSLMADSLPKTIWLSIHLIVYNEELGIPGQTATGKESSNPFMAGSLLKTIHFCDSLLSDEDSFELIELMILCTNFLTMVHDLENLKTSHLLKKDFLQIKRAEDDKEEFGYILLVFMELTVKKLDD
ncbi:putative reverse transcriptase domain-containing protein [Tanacetum coccineum]